MPGDAPISDHQTLVRGLADALRRTAGEVEQIETHISSLLLAGDHVYKLKKPLDLGFLDFTTLDRRKRACDDELRLNRRLAPDLYLDVIAITGTAEQPTLDGTGALLDYAVHMRRFPQEQRLDRVLARGALRRNQLDALAVAVATFHQHHAARQTPEWLSEAEPLVQPVLANLQQLQTLDAAAPEAVGDWVHAQLPGFRQRLQARLGDGAVRECHGDLHLENIALIDDCAVPFDCIEFDERLRWMDVISDLAFLLMDLDFRGAEPMAARILSQYLDVTGDHAGVRDLRFYQVYRALVRAKIHAIKLADGRQSAERQTTERQQRDRYLALAERYCEARRPQLVTTCGLSGSGKSTAALALVENSAAIRLRSDVERKRLFGLDALARTDAPVAGAIYGAEASAATYDALAERATLLLQAGWSVIIDAACLQRRERDRFRALAAQLNCRWRLLYCEAPVKELERRLVTRARSGSDPSEADTSVLSFQREHFQPPDADELRHRITPEPSPP